MFIHALRRGKNGENEPTGKWSYQWSKSLNWNVWEENGTKKVIPPGSWVYYTPQFYWQEHNTTCAKTNLKCFQNPQYSRKKPDREIKKFNWFDLQTNKIYTILWRTDKIICWSVRGEIRRDRKERKGKGIRVPKEGSPMPYLKYEGYDQSCICHL